MTREFLQLVALLIAVIVLFLIMVTPAVVYLYTAGVMKHEQEIRISETTTCIITSQGPNTDVDCNSTKEANNEPSTAQD